MQIFIFVNGQTTQDPSPTSFGGYPIQYQTIDLYSCITATTTIVPDDISTICLTSTEAITTTEQATTNIQPTTTTTTTIATTTTTTTTTATTTTITTATTITTKTTTTTTSTLTSTTTISTTTTTTATTTTTKTTTTTTTTKTTTTTTSTTTTVTTTTTTTVTTTTTKTTTTTTTTKTTTTTTVTTTSSTTSTTTTVTTTTATTTTTKTVAITTNVITSALSTAVSTTAITSIALVTMIPSKQDLIFVAPICASQSIGLSCNISSNPCTMAQPCLNLATCYPNISVPDGYVCSCVSGFAGVNCDVDNRVCRPSSSCLYGGTCNSTSNDTNCVCAVGKTGSHCEYEIDICANISCQNNAQCVSSYGNWSCRCTNTDLYSGTYCETKSSSLRIKEIFSRSFGCVAIGCISTVVSFFLIMDVLKYIFGVDPADNDLRSWKDKKNHYRQLQNDADEKYKREKRFNPKNQFLLSDSNMFMHKQLTIPFFYFKNYLIIITINTFSLQSNASCCYEN